MCPQEFEIFEGKSDALNNFLSSTIANVVPYLQKALGRHLLGGCTNLFSYGLALKGSA